MRAKKIHSLALLWLISLGLLGNTIALAATQPEARTMMLASAQTGRDYRIQVSLPEGKPPEQGYPVLYVLDGNIRFPLLEAARQTLSRNGIAHAGEPWIIVGIGYPGVADLDPAARAEDYTPPVPDLTNTGDPSGHAQGGADRFLSFIEDELKPALAAHYPMDNQRQALLGHSYGGLLTLYALLTRPESFSDYLAISPSLWWNQGYLIERYRQWLKQEPHLLSLPSRRLLVVAGSLEQSPRPGEEGSERARRRQANAMIDNASRLANDLQTLSPMLEVHFKLFEGEDHGSVMWPASRYALEFLGITIHHSDD